MTDAAKTDYKTEHQELVTLMWAKQDPYLKVAAWLADFDQRIRAEARREAFEEALEACSDKHGRDSRACYFAIEAIAKAAAQDTPVTQAKDKP
jgi:hypothetical protein